MTPNQLQTLEAELQRRGYRKYTTCLTSTESWAWFKTFDKETDEDGWAISGYQVAFRVWDRTKFNRHSHILSPEGAYGFDFWTSPLGTSARLDFTSNWYPISDFDTFECMAAEFHAFARKHIN